jgi:hypothetical protein
MLEGPILSGMIGRWTYVLIDCDLVYESLHPRRACGIADFIIDKRIEGKENISCSSVCP